MNEPTIVNADCLDALRDLPDNSVHAVVTDPPYGLSNTNPKHVAETITRWANGDREYMPEGRGYMGAAWDAFVPPVAVWDECLRVLKPGGHMLAFAGSRTADLMGLSIRLAGFDIKDTIMWIKGNGFPKGQDMGRLTGDDTWKGWSTTLKPVNEPIIVARKSFRGTVAANVQEHGTGALNIDACRIPIREDLVRTEGGSNHPDIRGRYPTNVILDEHAAAELDQRFGYRRGGGTIKRNNDSLEKQKDHSGGDGDDTKGAGYIMEGGASRFFYCARASQEERPYIDGVAHPTVKPLKLMEYLVTLVTPPGGMVLDPFAGSGTTIEAALNKGFDPIGIEREADYLPLIQARVNRATNKED